MYAAQKYSADDRIATAQHWARTYPDRVPVILSSPHWSFHSFKCLLVPGTMDLKSLSTIVLTKWGRKFSKLPDRIVLDLAPGSCLLMPDMLDPTTSCAHLSTQHASSDGLLYLTARVIH